MDSVLHQVLNNDNLLFLVLGALGALAIVGGTISGIVRHQSRERSRREIAAYIAEGSMTPEQGAKLMKASPKGDGDN
ncbi:MAG: hypothetical protein AAF747_01915 [Planctomycetota bacterium]